MFKYSSAGLVWKYLKLENKYPAITELITLIDENDVGIRKATVAELPRIVGAYNTEDIYDNIAQFEAFNKAMEVVITVITSMKEYQDKLDVTAKTLSELYSDRTDWEIANNIIEAPSYLIGWDNYLNGKNTPDLRAIIWPKDTDSSDEWQGQILPVKPGSYEQHGKGFEQDPSMTFVHSGKFFCVAPNKATMIKYLTIA
jgi:uncharacterized UPF0160 family protein